MIEKSNSNSVLSQRNRYQFLATLIVNIITFAHGIGVGWLSPTLAKIQAPNSPLEFVVSIDEVSWIGSTVGLGAVCGNIVTGVLLVYASCKLCIYTIAVPYACVWILVYYAKSVEYLYAARFFCGYTSGAGYLVVPIFVSEIADRNIRGTLSSMMLLAVNCGVLCSYIITTHLNYHIVPLIFIFLPILYAIANFFLPETPYYLLRMEQYTCAEQSYAFYRNFGAADDKQIYRAEFDALKMAISQNQGKQTAKLKYTDFFTKAALKGFAGSLVLSAGYQFSNVFSFITYMSDIFAQSGSVLSPNTSTIVVGAVQIIGVYTSTIFVDIWGRRILMLLSTSGIAFGCALFGLFSYLNVSYDLSYLNWIPLLLMIFIIYVANIGIIGLFFVVLIELFPSKICSIAAAISSVVLSLLVFTTLKVFPLMLFYLGLPATMLCSALAALLTFIYFLIFLPETKGKSMVED